MAWQSGKSLCWGVTVICPLVKSYVTGSAREAGAAAELAASRKEEKYAGIGSEYVPLCAHRGRNLGPDEHVGMPTVFQSEKKDLLGVRQ